jgi:hypothetical protein
LQHLRGESGVGDITDMFAHVCFSLRVKFFILCGLCRLDVLPDWGSILTKNIRVGKCFGEGVLTP